MIGRLARAGRSAAAAWRAGGAGGVVDLVRRAVSPRIEVLARRIDEGFAVPFAGPPRRRGTLFVGYVEAALGLGESLRGLVRAYGAQGLPFAIQPFNAGVENRLLGPFMPERYDLTGRYGVTVVEVAADQLAHLFPAIRRRRLMGSHTILRTYWELPDAPAAWAPLLAGIDELWAPTRFVAEAFRTIFPGPILIVPPCVDVPATAAAAAYSKAAAGLPAGRFHFLFSFDYQSSPARKNPLGVLHAFQAAFPDRSEAVGLVIKTTGLPPPHLAAPAHHDLRLALRQAATADPRIRIVDAILSRAEMLALIAASGCYVSLHRSEGFGLGMAEAMALGTAVIGTDYSGSRDFLTPETGFPVAYRLRPVQPGEYPGGEGQHWAEPDAVAAAAAMRQVFDEPEAVAPRAAAARALMATRYGSDAVGRIAARRITEILAHRG